MEYTRREFGKTALASLPAVALFGNPMSALAQAKPNSPINGVQIGTITYSYRSMPDQSAEATLKYILASGISAVELMGGPVNAYARDAVPVYADCEAGAAAGGGARAVAAAVVAAADAARPDPATLTATWNGEKCAPGQPARTRSWADGPLPRRRRRHGGGGGGEAPRRRSRSRRPQAEERKWRMGLSMDIFKDLRKMYNDAGVTHLRGEGRAAGKRRGSRVHVRGRRGARRRSHHARAAERPERGRRRSSGSATGA